MSRVTKQSLRFFCGSIFVFSILSTAVLAQSNVVLYASQAPVRSGKWGVVADASAAGGYAIGSPALGAPLVKTPLVDPANYFEITFTAESGRAYQLWLRGKSLGSTESGAVYVQFSDSETGSGSAIDRIGTTAAAIVLLYDCSGISQAGWVWHDNGLCSLGHPFYFKNSGTHTVRVQLRQDGVSLDQILLSPQQYLSSAPGNSVILPATSPLSTSFSSLNLSTTAPSVDSTTSLSSSTLNAMASSNTTITSSTAVKLKVMEANIFYGGHGTDDKINLTRVADWIVKMNPDVVSLIEVLGGSNDPALLAGLMKQKTGHTWYYSYVPKYPGCNEGVMILTKWTIKSTSHYFMSYQMPIAQATVSVGGKLINFFSTHFQWPDNDSYQRQVEAKQLVSFASKFAEPRIIAGDFNAQDYTTEIKIILNGYIDGWMKAVNANTATAYPDNPPSTYTRTRKSRIDFVFYAKNATNLSVSSGQVPDTRNLSVKPVIRIGTLDDKGVRPSDHNFSTVTFYVH